MTESPPWSFERRFLEKFQRLLAEGDFSSTCKFAVLLGLTELSVETATASGYRDSFTTLELARRVAALYWPQIRPFSPTTGREPIVLSQNSGKPAKILSLLADLASAAGTLPIGSVMARQPEAYERCILAIEWKLIEMPLPRLQDNRCFYYRRGLASAVVDHFLPWARYPDSRIENLVVAHPKCNSSRSHHMADSSHLDRWLERFDASRPVAGQLHAIATDKRWPEDPHATLAIARHLHGAHPPDARLWRAPDGFSELGSSFGGVPARRRQRPNGPAGLSHHPRYRNVRRSCAMGRCLPRLPQRIEKRLYQRRP